jgi:dienelactone hydrolase
VNFVEHTVTVDAAGVTLDGDLTVLEGAHGVVVFAHGSGSDRFSPRNRAVARVLQDAGLATLLIDLLTPEEAALDMRTRHLRFDIDLLAGRLVTAVDWLGRHPDTRALSVGCFGASTGAAAALVAAALRPGVVRAVVSRGGRPDLAAPHLSAVRAPTLLIVGALDAEVLGLNRVAMAHLSAEVRLEVVPGAGHLFEEPGTLAAAADLAAEWFTRHLPQQHSS